MNEPGRRDNESEPHFGSCIRVPITRGSCDDPSDRKKYDPPSMGESIEERPHRFQSFLSMPQGDHGYKAARSVAYLDLMAPIISTVH
ncbi:hypothetical protein AVEN_245701-1 [Araneus ventricosus]|uniref:Uncharacterized protein n=1 Tax=Araneus ventricosus TaxID=182803 RepID=A0A4Y2FTA3_ARAVE|nr:hypothetical protein AVEN_245701-1 [Araneus ventricosus]